MAASPAGQTVANVATTKVSTAGKINIFLSAGAAHVIVDIVGYYV